MNNEVGAAVVWYDTETGGTPLAVTEALESKTYYAGNCTDQSTRKAVAVSLANCSRVPAAGAVTAWTNVMYDFQSQRLEAYATTTSGGDATEFKWQVSATNDPEGFTDIPGAPNSAIYTIPVDYINDFVTTTEKSKELWFRCIRSNPAGTATINAALGMLFIRTNTAGYGIQDGIKYLEIETKNQHYPDGKVKIALTNLGATDDNNLGDFYQWGRVADGHQEIGWTKQTGTSRNNAFDAVTLANKYPSSGTVTGTPGSPDLSLEANGQVVSGTAGYGQFIVTSTAIGNDWSNNTNRWGDGSGVNNNNNRLADISHSSWTFGAQPPAGNNPCPSGWTIPSRWQWKDMHNGDGSSITFDNNWSPSVPVNNWTPRPAQYGAAGSAIITNTNGEQVFLPAAGLRTFSNGNLTPTDGYYWGSTYRSMGGADLQFSLNNSNPVFRSGDAQSYAYGFSVRCIAE